MTNYKDLTDDQLINLLFTEADRLPRSAVDEFVSRGERVVAPLAEIVSDPLRWDRDAPEWWAVIHASFILGAIGGKDVAAPLANALRLSVIYDCDWVTNAVPSIFAKIGTAGMEPMKRIAKDKTADWYIRATAIEALAGLTIGRSELEDEVFPFLASILNDEDEDWDVRGSAGNTLLDFLRGEYRDSLMTYGREGMRRRNEDFFAMPMFDDKNVEAAFSKGKRRTSTYTNDWLDFYGDDEIKKRQERWRKKDRENRKIEDTEKSRIGSYSESVVRDSPKIGRNAPCPCGSGKKYKKCCLGK